MSLRRSSFKRPEFIRPPKSPLVPITDCRGVYARVGDEVAAVPKDVRTLAPGDEERLWKHVRSLPCARCWREGNTEVSHSNQIIDGKGRGLKAYSYRVAALCHECHHMIDQGKDFNKAQRREAWESAYRWTVGELFSRGLVRPV